MNFSIFFNTFYLLISVSFVLPKFFGALAKLRKATVSFVKSVRSSVCQPVCVKQLDSVLWCLSVRLSVRQSAWNSSTPPERIFMKFDIRIFFENCAFCEIMLKNIVEPDRIQTMRTRIVCWMIKATNTHSAYVIIIVFHRHNGCTNTPQCYAIRTVSRTQFCI